MKLRVIENPNPPAKKALPSDKSFFNRREFGQIASLFSRAATYKALHKIAVDVSEDQKHGSITLHRSAQCPGYMQLQITKFGPKNTMYEVYQQGKGRVAKSGLFTRAYEKLAEEVEALMPKPH